MVVKHSTVADETYETLKKQILTGHYAPGTRLQLEAVSKELGVSPTPLREAFLRLEKEGILEIISRRGTYVRLLNRDAIKQFYEIREVLEGLSASLASSNNSASDIAELKAINEEFRKALEAKDIEAALDVDIRFHNLISELSRNDKLKEVINNFLFTNLFNNAGISSVFLEKGAVTHAGHEAIIGALERGDSAGAEAIMREQIRHGKEILLSVFD